MTPDKVRRTWSSHNCAHNSELSSRPEHKTHGYDIQWVTITLGTYNVAKYYQQGHNWLEQYSWIAKLPAKNKSCQHDTLIPMFPVFSFHVSNAT